MHSRNYIEGPYRGQARDGLRHLGLEMAFALGGMAVMATLIYALMIA